VPPGTIDRRTVRAVWWIAFLAVGAFYYWIIGIGAEPQRFAWNSGLDRYYGLPSPAIAKGSWDINGYYDLLGRAFASGHLYLPIKPQPELLALADPQDNRVNGPYKLLDTVLYQRRYYLYHGATPALLLFAPWYLVTRHDLPENFAAFVLALAGFVFLSRLFLRVTDFAALRLRASLLALCLFALGIGQLAPFLLHRVKVYEIAIVCGYACVSAGFYFLFRWIADARRQSAWAVFSGLAFGLAAGARPHLALAAVAGLVVLVLFSRPAAFAFLAPVAMCGLAIAGYNYARFGNPLEFGLRYQLADTPYQNIRLSLVNEPPGLYYLLLCPPDLVPEFPFVRVAWRQPFDALENRLPARYFLEPTAGILGVCPLAAIALLLPLLRRRFSIARELLVFLSAMAALAVVCMLFVAATGLTSQRFEVDFLPLLLFVACVVACRLLSDLRAPTKALASAGFALLALYTIAANAALAIQGPYDQFVQASPRQYVKLAKWFSPFDRFRPVEDPPLHLEASFDFAQPCVPGIKPLVSTGEFGSRYLLSEACYPDGRLQLWSETSVQSNERQTVDVPYSAGFNLVDLKFTPADRTMTLSWNGKTVLAQRLRFLVTSPSQIHFGADPTLGNHVRFPGRIAVFEDKLTPAANSR
jgi:hypothetical protein